ncbi:MAG: aldo/keto reductase [Chloroflexi bacterium]|nr:aldo/keto reductase [Chloroflexota bacterium]
MRYRTFGTTGISASEVGFGLWTVSTTWWGEKSPDEAIRLLRRAYELGITFYDTADTYGNGAGETLLADALADHRDDITIATKFGYDWYRHAGTRRGQQEIPQDWTPAHARFACEQSLRRLRTDRIDIYQLHNVRFDGLRRDDLFAELEQLKVEGKIRAYAAALGPAIGWRDEGLHAIQERGVPIVHHIYNLLEQDPGRDFMAAARTTGATFMVRVPHASGMLEGKYTLDTTFAPTDHRSHRPRQWLVTGLQKIDRLGFLTESGERTLGQAALQWILADPSMVTVLPNIYDEDQLAEFAAAPDTPELTDDELAQVADLFAHGFYLEPATVAG